MIEETVFYAKLTKILNRYYRYYCMRRKVQDIKLELAKLADIDSRFSQLKAPITLDNVLSEIHRRDCVPNAILLTAEGESDPVAYPVEIATYSDKLQDNIAKYVITRTRPSMELKDNEVMDMLPNEYFLAQAFYRGAMWDRNSKLEEEPEK